MTGEETTTKPFPSESFERRATAAPAEGLVPDRETDRGATLVEYALLLVLVLLVAFFSIQIFGETIIALFETTSDTLDNAPNNNAN